MAARLEHPTPFPSSQKLPMDAYAQHSAAAPPRSLALPTPSPSPSSCSDASSTSSSSAMLSFAPHSDVFDPLLRRIHHLSLSQPSSPPSFASSKLPRHRPPPLFCPTPPVDFVPRAAPSADLRYGHDIERPQSISGSLSTSSQRLYDDFMRSKSRVIRLFNLPRSSIAASQLISSLFSPANNLTTPTSTSPYSTSFSDLASVRMWTLREEYGGTRVGEEDSVWIVFPTHAEACSALSMSGSLSMATALERDLEPYEKLRKYEMNDASLDATISSQSMYKDLFPPSPTSPECPVFALPETSASFARQEHQQRPYQLSSNPPNPRSAFRHGDWICASPSCAAHNFGRNIVCIGCGSPRILSDAQSQASDGSYNGQFLSRVASPRFTSGSPAFNMPSPSPSVLGLSNASVFHQQQQQHLHHLQQAPKQSALTHQLLTPSGRALAVGGKVQNVSRDPLAPCIVYWPDNEPLPEQGQIRPATATQIHQPPIMNTGNKGPIEHQPGDWICHKCEYLNWRRRKVCQTCFPFAEGNGDSVSAAMQAERLAYLATLYAQNQPSQHSAPAPSAHANNHAFPRSSATVPFPSGMQRHSFVSGQQQQQQQQPRFATHTRMNNNQHHHYNQAFARRSNSTPEMPSGNVLYQTPISPSRAQFSLMSMADVGAQTGHLLPSFLKNEIKPIARTPLSLSPSSSSSAELSHDEYDDELNSPGSVIGAPSTFYAQQKTGSGKLSSGSGSTSSLTLGGSIWAMGCDEDKTWNAVALPSPDYLAGMKSRKPSFEPLKNM